MAAKYTKQRKNTNRDLVCLLIFVGLTILITLLPLDAYYRKITNLCLINVVLGLSLNLVNGYTGLFSLGHYGFMALGAYVTAILTMSQESKEAYYMIEPAYDWILKLHLPLIPALIFAGLIAAFFGFLISLPVLRLNDDYLAIASMGFAEIILVLIRTQFRLTNGALGLKGVPRTTSSVLYGAVAIIMVIFMLTLTKSNKGRNLIAIRENEIAARAVGINAFRHKVISFTWSSFWAGVGGGLMATLIGTVNPMQFTFQLTFNILLIVVLGGMGKTWGNIVSAIIVTFALEILRFLDEPMDLLFIKSDGMPGLRMVIFSLLLIIIVNLRARNGKKKRNKKLEEEKEALPNA
ncbi:MAG: branched-chain amino acid ABC transporter permease [Eubacteriales bacterium]|nr:branched-chain amino acid ABC transporter permease [Eubacteriales bacterium]